ncbi:acylphosphatase [Afifella sp. IM 167]|uniref:acylphosphatase n=1 Tax=Afifella sp. IM 167 TaxID=2033586 RepID=UPI001CCE18E6|nr:acylphosphatase [Afifella sp. IM 167]
MPAKSIHVLISGRVQGVGFRAWTEAEASRLGLSGWVKNRPDGAVEAVFSGPAERIDDMLARCRAGPRFASVGEVRILGDVPEETGPFRIARPPR